MKELAKKYRSTLFLLAVTFIIFLLDRATGITIATKTALNFKEMLSVLPPIFILLGLLEIWVPREKIIPLLGEKSGVRGVILSIILGAAAAGPLYAAFPVAAVMLKKGARLFNIFVFIGAWSTLKIPMFLFESASMGLPFALYRAAFNIPGIVLIAYILNGSYSEEAKNQLYDKFAQETT
jgi:uncharacterized membrane protein YraQ (UPF0718 family)